MTRSYISQGLQDAYHDCGDDYYTDEELVALAQAGHTSATVILCHRYVPLISRYSHVRQLRSMESDLEATLWETFLYAIQTYNLNGKIPFAGFVKSRIYYTEMNLFRKSVHQWNHESLLHEEDDSNPIIHIPAEDDTEQEALAHLQMAALKEALSRIDTVHAALLEQILFQGKSISDMAESYGMSRQGMHKKYKKAITLVQQELERSKD